MTEGNEMERADESLGEGKGKFMKPAECRQFMRKTLAREFEEIVKGFVVAAKKGSCPHVKLATELLNPAHSEPKKKKGTAAKYWEMLQREQRERDALAAASEELEAAREDAEGDRVTSYRSEG